MARLFARQPQVNPSQVTHWSWARVPQGTTREIAAPEGRLTLHCRSGEAWITQDGDPRDVTLQASESYPVHRRGRGRVTVHALQGDCTLAIEVER